MDTANIVERAVALLGELKRDDGYGIEVVDISFHGHAEAVEAVRAMPGAESYIAVSRYRPCRYEVVKAKVGGVSLTAYGVDEPLPEV